MRLSNFQKSTIVLIIACIFLASALKNPEEQKLKKETCLAITFDDGHKTDITTAAPLLEKYAMKGTFFIITSEYQKNKPNKLNETDIEKLIRQGHEIGSHTMTHQYTSSIDPKERYKEIVNSKLLLEHDFNITVNSIAFPYSDYKPDLLDFTYIYYKNIRRDQIAVKKNTDPSEICGLIIKVKKSKENINLLFHDVEDLPGDWGTTPENFKQILDCINKTGIKVDTLNNCNN